MDRNQIIEPIGFIVASVTALFSFILFYSDNGMFLGSLAAALMAACLVWGTYLILRLVLISIRK